MKASGWILILLIVVGTACSTKGVGRCEMSSAEATTLAVSLANDECTKRFGEAPFTVSSFLIEQRDGKWTWGRVDPKGIQGYSATVSFDRCGGDPEVAVYFSTDKIQGLYR